MENYIPRHPSQLPDDLRTYAREMRTQMTDAEALLWKLLRNQRIANVKFRRQHPIGRYILDFYCDEKKLAIELDGSQHMDAFDYDQQRDAWLKSQGIQVLRFWNNQVLLETESVMEVIYGVLADNNISAALAPSPPAPLPLAGEGSNPSGTMNNLSCRPGCGACCIAPSISSPIPGMPAGKPAGVRCVQLDDANRCQIFGRPERPAVCGSLQPSNDMCGTDNEHAMIYLSQLELLTAA